MSRPWFKFWKDDWRTCAGIRMMTKAARSDFLDLLLLMYDGTGGFCEVNGKRLNLKQAISVAGIEETHAAEMLDAGVIVLVDGCPFSAKVAAVMADQEQTSGSRSEAGRIGAARRWQMPSKNMANAIKNDGKQDGKSNGKRDGNDRRQKTEEKKTELMPNGIVPVDTGTADVHKVFDHWKRLWPSESRLSEKRRAKIQRAIREVGLDGAIKSLDGWRMDDWAERHVKLGNFDVEVLFRSSEKVERGIDLFNNPPRGTQRPRNAMLIPDLRTTSANSACLFSDEDMAEINKYAEEAHD